MKTTNLVPWIDFLQYAVEIGYDWNEARDILVDDGVPPMYEKKRQYDIEEVEQNLSGWSDKSREIVLGFMKKNKVDEITVIDE